MTANKLQEAITLIKSGDRQTGQQLLTEVLQADPRNETAWLWMSALMSGEKRRFCLEKVLSINPDHPQARAQLEKMDSAAPPARQTPAPAPAARPAAEPPRPPLQPAPIPAPVADLRPAASSAWVQETPLPRVWLIPNKYLSSVVYLLESIFLVFEISPERAPELIEATRQGITPQDLDQLKSKYRLASVNHVSLTKVTSATWFGDSLKIVAVDNSGREKKIDVSLNKQNSEAVLTALQERLGPGFRRINRPISRLKVMTSALILFAITLCGTGGFWWFVRGLQAEVEAEGRIGGSARTRGIAALLLLIGPNGFLCIGGVILVILIIAIISSLAKPPEETVLTREAG